MNSLSRNILHYFSLVMALLMISGCSSGNKTTDSNYEKILRNDSIPQVIKNIVQSVHDNEASAFAREVAYPLQRPYPLKDILDEEEMKEYYPVLVDDSLRNVLVNSTPEEWQQFGWRGYSLKDGSYLWIDESIYAVNYVSSSEENLIDSLTRVELNSLPENLRRGWKPILTLLDPSTGKVYRIDVSVAQSARATPEYRLSVYDNVKDIEALHSMPDLLLSGYMKVEGTASVVSYVFQGKNNEGFVIYPDDPGSGAPVIDLPDGSEQELRKAYWYEFVE